MINQLTANIKKTGAPIVVGLDPMLDYVPGHIQKKAFGEYGETLEGARRRYGSLTGRSWIRLTI